MLGAYREGSLPENGLAPEIAGLPQADVGGVLLAVHAEVRGKDEDEATREIHESLLEAEISEVLEKMVERGEFEGVVPGNDDLRQTEPTDADEAAEDAWRRFAEDLARLEGEELREALVTVAAEDAGRPREDAACGDIAEEGRPGETARERPRGRGEVGRG